MSVFSQKGEDNFMKKASLKTRVRCHARFLMDMYQFFRKQEPDPGSFRFLTEKQVYRDCLESLKQNQIISDYNLSTGEILYEDPVCRK